MSRSKVWDGRRIRGSDCSTSFDTGREFVDNDGVCLSGVPVRVVSRTGLYGHKLESQGQGTLPSLRTPGLFLSTPTSIFVSLLGSLVFPQRVKTLW